jgi:hypothetical protein
MQTWAPAAYVAAVTPGTRAPVRHYRFTVGVALLSGSAYLIGEAAPDSGLLRSLQPAIAGPIAGLRTIAVAIQSDDPTIRWLGLFAAAVLASIVGLLIYAAGRLLAALVSVTTGFILGSLHVQLFAAMLALGGSVWSQFLQPRPVLAFGVIGALLFAAGAFPRLRARYEIVGLAFGLASLGMWPSLESVLTLLALGAIYAAMVRGQGGVSQVLPTMRSALVAAVSLVAAAQHAVETRASQAVQRRSDAPLLWQAAVDLARASFVATELMVRLVFAGAACVFLVSVRSGSDGWAAVLGGLAIIACVAAVSRRSVASRWLIHFAVIAAVAAAWVAPISGSIWVFALKQAAVFIVGLVAILTDQHLAACGIGRTETEAPSEHATSS